MIHQITISQSRLSRFLPSDVAAKQESLGAKGPGASRMPRMPDGLGMQSNSPWEVPSWRSWPYWGLAGCADCCRPGPWPAVHSAVRCSGSLLEFPCLNSKIFLRLATFLHKRPLSHWKKAEKFKNLTYILSVTVVREVPG